MWRNNKFFIPILKIVNILAFIASKLLLLKGSFVLGNGTIIMTTEEITFYSADSKSIDGLYLELKKE